MSIDNSPLDDFDVVMRTEAAALRSHVASTASLDAEWQEFVAARAAVRVVSGMAPASRRWLKPVAVAAVAASIATLVVLQVTHREPPTQSPDVTTPTTSTTVGPTTTIAAVEPDRTTLARTGPFELLTIIPVDEVGREGIDVVVQSPTGDSRIVRHVDNSELPDGWTFGGYGTTSSTGWLALGAQSAREFGWVFVDLLSVDRPPRLVRGITDGAQWGPTDLFALSLNGGRPAVIDPLTGDTREISNAKYPGGHPDIIWTANGEGFLASKGGSFGGISEIDGSTNIQTRTWRMTPLDGSADQAGVPALDPFGTTRYVAEGGSWLTVGACGSVLDLCLPNGQLGDGTYQDKVVVADAEGNSTTWYDHDLEGARLMESSFSFDGTALWLLLERPTGAGTGAELVLARVERPRELQTVATLPIAEPPPDVTIEGGGREVRFFASMRLSPDDGIVVINASTVAATPESIQMLVRTDATGSSIPFVGTLAGYLPASVSALLT